MKTQLSDADIYHKNCVQIVELCRAIAHKPRSNEFAALRRNREVPKSTRVSINYCAELRCKEFAAQRRNCEAKILHETATNRAKQCCKEFAA